MQVFSFDFKPLRKRTLRKIKKQIIYKIQNKYNSIFKHIKTKQTKKNHKMEPPVGVEPTTYGLQIRCSTS